jgi:DNA-binding NarL/FixJ family response regulator
MRVLIVDDHPIVRTAVAWLLRNHPDFEFCGEAECVNSALEKTQSLKPELTILDLVMGGRDGIELVGDLKKNHPSGRILVYSGFDERIYAIRALRAGASGYVMKSRGIENLNRAVTVVAKGDRFVSEDIHSVFMSEVLDGKLAFGAINTSGMKALSNRELQILNLLGMNYRSSQIAEDLNLSIKTVGTYCERLKDKLNAQNGAELRTFATAHYRKAMIGKMPSS